ncbi:hypothetical protein SLITO_v1c02610 [Spiroplasma litorale]|uniref:Uncharacterized protein n=1 Tax=Spiroplasma litorale TaxID=216942 RepID=A0A0K1W159_9MOLU|nr:hypothetical protein [Spiroplasma litorale]AKX33916.1 hypothetical protein SLITO_v1c02610 [Spiroplasma litorale]
MDNIDQLKKRVQDLENELDIFKKKEEYLNNGIEKVKSIYDITRQNAEKIIYKSVVIANSLKDDAKSTLEKIKNNPNDLDKFIDELLHKNNHLLNNDINKVKKNIQEIVIKIINSK